MSRASRKCDVDFFEWFVLKMVDVSHVLTEATWSEQACSAEAWERVYREHLRYVWRCLRHLGIRSCDLEDVTHEVFLVIHRKLGSFEGRSTLKTWIYGICLRTASDYRKKASFRHEVASEVVPEMASQAMLEEGLEAERLRRKLVEHLQALNVEQREVFVLYEIEEVSMKDIAELLECPLQTAYSRLHAARASLQKVIARSGGV